MGERHNHQGIQAYIVNCSLLDFQGQENGPLAYNKIGTQPGGRQVTGLLGCH